jgi:hypothetical protein
MRKTSKTSKIVKKGGRFSNLPSKVPPGGRFSGLPSKVPPGGRFSDLPSKVPPGGRFSDLPSKVPPGGRFSDLLSKVPPGVASPKAIETLRTIARDNPQAVASLTQGMRNVAPHLGEFAKSATPVTKQFISTTIQNGPLTPSQRMLANAAVRTASNITPAALSMAARNPEGALKVIGTAINIANKSGVKIL